MTEQATKTEIKVRVKKQIFDLVKIEVNEYGTYYYIVRKNTEKILQVTFNNGAFLLGKTYTFTTVRLNDNDYELI